MTQNPVVFKGFSPKRGKYYYGQEEEMKLCLMILSVDPPPVYFEAKL
jgi:hypothetical protein